MEYYVPLIGAKPPQIMQYIALATPHHFILYSRQSALAHEDKIFWI
jgi:hypothetical protein